MVGTIDPEHLEHLDEQGFLVLRGLMDTWLLRELRQRVDCLFEIEGQGAGSEFKQEAGARTFGESGEQRRDLLARH